MKIESRGRWIGEDGGLQDKKVNDSRQSKETKKEDRMSLDKVVQLEMSFIQELMPYPSLIINIDKPFAKPAALHSKSLLANKWPLKIQDDNPYHNIPIIDSKVSSSQPQLRENVRSHFTNSFEINEYRLAQFNYNYKN